MINLVVPQPASIDASDPSIDNRAGKIEKWVKIIHVIQTIFNTAGAVCVSIPCAFYPGISLVQSIGVFCHFTANLGGTVATTIAIHDYRKILKERQSEMIGLGATEDEKKRSMSNLEKWHCIAQVGNFVITTAALSTMLAMSCLDRRMHKFENTNFFPFVFGLLQVINTPVVIGVSLFRVWSR